MRTLVTGGAGFIGSTLVDRLLGAGHDVDVVDSLWTGNLSNLDGSGADGGDRLAFHHLDIRDPAVVELITERKPELIFHLAAQADVRVSVARPVFDAEVNVLGSLQVLEGARRAGTRKVVVASSGGTIFGEPRPEDLPVRETHPQHPVSPYGVAKKVVDDYLFAYRSLHGLDFTALALANVYGPRQDPNGEAGVVAIFAGKLLSGDPCVIFGDGKQTRDFVYVDDVVDAFVRAIDGGSETLFNIGTGVETSVNELYESMAGAAGVTEPATHAPARAGELARSSLDPSLAGERLGWRPQTEPRSRRRRRARLVPHSPLTPISRAKAEVASGRGLRWGGARRRAATLPSPNHSGFDAPHDGDGHAGGLAHHQLGRGGDLVDDRHLGHLQLAAEGVGGATQVGDGGQTPRSRWPRRSRRDATSGRRCRTRSRPRRRRRDRGGRRELDGPTDRNPRAATRRSREPRSTDRSRRWRTRTRGGFRR